jgi:hypothetical protein
MTESEQQALSRILATPLLEKVFAEILKTRCRTDVDTVEKAALSQAYNMGVLASLNAFHDLAKTKQTVTLTTRKLRHE